MSVLKKKITEDFTCVHNAFIRDTELSIAAKGLLLVMLSLPDNWNFSIVGLQAIVPDGKDRVRTTLKVLEEKGYLRRNRLCDEKGMVTDWEYCFSDEPVFRKDENVDTEPSCPQSENPNVDKGTGEVPQSENPHVDVPNMGSPHLETPTAYKILSDKILKDQVLKDKSCGTAAQPAAENSKETDFSDEKEMKKRSPKKKVIDDAVFIEIISYLNKKANTRYRVNVESNRKYIRARLNQGYSVDDVKSVIDKKCREWLGTDMEKYLRPETLFCEKHFESYLNAPDGGSNVKTQAQPQQGTNMIDLLNAYMEE